MVRDELYVRGAWIETAESPRVGRRVLCVRCGDRNFRAHQNTSDELNRNRRISAKNARMLAYSAVQSCTACGRMYRAWIIQ